MRKKSKKGNVINMKRKWPNVTTLKTGASDDKNENFLGKQK